MKARLGLALLFAALLAGCGRNSEMITSPTGSPGGGSPGGGSTSSDQAEVASALAASPQVVEDGQYESSDPATAEAGPAGSLAAIRPLRWWRAIRSVERRFEFAFADTDSTGRPTRAVVTVFKRLNGSFNIAVGNPTAGGGEGGPAPGDSVRILHKPLEDHWVRRILLHRVRVNDHDQPVWKIVASSGVKVTSRNHSVEIASLRVQTADQDTTIADPLAFFFLRRMIVVAPGEEVKLTLTTNQNDDAVFLMLRDGRRRFTSNGDGTYSGVWRAPLMPGLRHVGADALTHGTLFDDEAPYDSQGWILPFVVRGPVPIAEMLP